MSETFPTDQFRGLGWESMLLLVVAWDVMLVDTWGEGVVEKGVIENALPPPPTIIPFPLSR